MSEFLGEARVIIRPDTTRFRAELAAQLAAATKGQAVRVPVTPVVAGGGGARDVGRQAAAARDLTAAQLAGIAASKEAAESAKRHAQQLGAVNKAAIANAAGLLGLRGAVLTASAGFIAATVAFQAFFKSIQAFAEFESTLATLRVVTGATTEEMTQLSEAALRLGADIRLPGVSAIDAAQAMLELSKAGLNAQESIAGAEGVLQLATAAQISNAEAAEITANALNSFGLAGSEAVAVADALANAANAAQGSISDFGLALRQVAAVGNQVGLSLQDTTSLLTLLARNGLRGSDAGTSLRVALLRLINPTKEANALLRGLNIQIRDLAGNVRADVFAQFAASTAALTPALRDAAAASVFGADAIRAVAIAGEEGAEGLQLARFQIDQQGTAAEVAAAKNAGLEGSLENLRNQSTSAGLALGETLAPALQEIVDVAGFAISGVDKFIRSLGRLGEAIDDLPGEGWGRRLFGEFDLIPVRLISQSEQEIAKLTEEMLNLQKARTQAQSGGASEEVIRTQTRLINELRVQIRALKVEAGIIVPPQTEAEKNLRSLSFSLKRMQETAARNLEKGFVDIDLDAAIDRLSRDVINAAVRIGSGADAAAKQSFKGLTTSITAALDVFKIDPDGELADEAP